MKLRKDVQISSRRIRHLLRGFAVIIFALVFLGTSFAESVSSGDFAVETWQNDNGLPQNSVTDVFQSKNGYIYAGTYNGIARFDGVRFVIYDSASPPALKNSRITS